MLVGFLGVVELVDLHELLQTLPEVQGEKVDPDQAARIQDQLQGVELHVEVGTRDWRSRRKAEICYYFSIQRGMIVLLLSCQCCFKLVKKSVLDRFISQKTKPLNVRIIFPNGVNFWQIHNMN